MGWISIYRIETFLEPQENLSPKIWIHFSGGGGGAGVDERCYSCSWYTTHHSRWGKILLVGHEHHWTSEPRNRGGKEWRSNISPLSLTEYPV